MSEPNWFVNLIFWWLYGLLQQIVAYMLGFIFAVFGDYDWGRVQMVDIGASLAETEDATVMSKINDMIDTGSYGA